MSKPLDLTQAAAFLGCSTSTLRRKAVDGLIRGTKIGGWKFMEEDLVELVRGSQNLEHKSCPAINFTNARTQKTGTSISAKSMGSALDEALKRVGGSLVDVQLLN